MNIFAKKKKKRREKEREKFFKISSAENFTQHIISTTSLLPAKSNKKIHSFRYFFFSAFILIFFFIHKNIQYEYSLESPCSRGILAHNKSTFLQYMISVTHQGLAHRMEILAQDKDYLAAVITSMHQHSKQLLPRYRLSVYMIFIW